MELKIAENSKKLCREWNFTQEQLAEARKRPVRFDENPEYRAHAGMMFYYSPEEMRCYDDRGETAADTIIRFMREERLGACLDLRLEEIQYEK